MKKLTEKARKTILSLYASGKSYRAFSRLTGVSKSKIQQILASTSVNKKNILSGQPKKLSERKKKQNLFVNFKIKN